jgi:bifunctional DNase/RNase
MAIEVRGLFMPRPLTYNFMAKLLEAVGAVMEEVRVETLKNDTFYAVAKIRCGDRVQEVDARPSDAITLAIRMNCSILVSEDVMERAGQGIPQGWGELGKGSERIVQELEDRLKKRREILESQSEDAREKSRSEFLSYLYGSGS